MAEWVDVTTPNDLFPVYWDTVSGKLGELWDPLGWAWVKPHRPLDGSPGVYYWNGLTFPTFPTITYVAIFDGAPLRRKPWWRRIFARRRRGALRYWGPITKKGAPPAPTGDAP